MEEKYAFLFVLFMNNFMFYVFFYVGYNKNQSVQLAAPPQP